MEEVEKLYDPFKTFLIDSVRQIPERFQFDLFFFFVIILSIDPQDAEVNLLPQILKSVDKQKPEDEWRSNYLADGLPKDVLC